MTALQQVQSTIHKLSVAEKQQLLRYIALEIDYPGRAIVHTEGICGGDARIDGTRLTVWGLVEYRQLGADDDELLQNFPSLTLGDLKNAWLYYENNRDEIEHGILENGLS